MRGKGKPRELSSKKPVDRQRRVVEYAKYAIRDPRYLGTQNNPANKDTFLRRYSFLFEGKMREEKDAIACAISCGHKNTIRDNSFMKLRRAKDKLEQGITTHNTFIKKKSDTRSHVGSKKILHLVKGFQEKGNLDKVLHTRRKKNVSRDKKYLYKSNSEFDNRISNSTDFVHR